MGATGGSGGARFSVSRLEIIRQRPGDFGWVWHLVHRMDADPISQSAALNGLACNTRDGVGPSHFGYRLWCVGEVVALT